ncbi:MAG: hypothetical protein V4472_21835, partial [Pseudomonadota bacterium]
KPPSQRARPQFAGLAAHNHQYRLTAIMKTWTNMAPQPVDDLEDNRRRRSVILKEEEAVTLSIRQQPT